MAVKGQAGCRERRGEGSCGIISDIESVAFMGHSIQWQRSERAHGKGQCRCLLLLNGAYDLYFVLFFVFSVFVFALMWLLLKMQILRTIKVGIEWTEICAKQPKECGTT